MRSEIKTYLVLVGLLLGLTSESVQAYTCSNTENSIDSILVEELLNEDVPSMDLHRTLAKLETLAGYYHSVRDPKEAFAAVYALVTQTLIDWIQQGRFQHSDFVAKTSLHFYQMYRWAILTDCGVSPDQSFHFWAPESWKQVFEKQKGPHFITPSQNLVLSMTAHILHDLPYGIVEGAGMQPLQNYESDYFRMNQLFQDLFDPMMNILSRIDGLPELRPMNRLLRSVFLPWIFHARSKSFQHALELQGCGQNQACKKNVMKKIEKISSKWSRRWSFLFPSRFPSRLVRMSAD